MGKAWAIAKNLIIEFLRMRALIIFVVITIACLTLGLGFWLHGTEGQADEKIKTFLSYSLRFISGFLSLLIIFVSIASITRDIKRKEIFTVATKPVSRGCFLVGKFAGLALLSLILLAVSVGLVYGTCRVLQRTEPATDAERQRLDELVFVARRSVKPPLPDVSQEADEKIQETLAETIRRENLSDPGQIDLVRRRLIREIPQQLVLRRRSVPPGGQITWHFSGIKPTDPENSLVYIRYKQDVSISPPGLFTIGEWVYGPQDPTLFGGERLQRKDAIRTVHEFPVPVSAVSDEGDLYVTYRNSVANYGATVIYPPDTGIEALYVAGGFEANFLRTHLLLYLRLLFLCVLGLAMGVWLSFPVAVLFTLAVFFIGVCSSFISKALEWEATQAQVVFFKLIMPLLPKFSLYDPVGEIEKGRIVSAHLLASCLFFMVLVKGGFLTLFGYLVFRFRELAKVIT